MGWIEDTKGPPLHKMKRIQYDEGPEGCAPQESAVLLYFQCVISRGFIFL